MSTRFNYFLATMAVIMMTFAVSSKTQAQGFRIGNVLQAGGGQGFRLGGPRVGMHFGGGQGASFGVGNLGMRFGNGQGARFGGQSYGMQFGGQQGTQFGRLQTTPVVTPGTYYYQDVRQLAYPGTVYTQPVYQQPVVSYPALNAPASNYQTVPNFQPQQTYVQDPVISVPVSNNVVEQNLGATPQVSYDIASELQSPNQGEIVVAAPAEGSSIEPVADQASEVMTELETEASPSVLETPEVQDATLDSDGSETIDETNTSAEPERGTIRITLSESATETLTLDVNGESRTLAPGSEIILEAGQDWAVKFDAGLEMEERVADLSTAGEFHFSNTDDEGWVLMPGVADEISAQDPAKEEAGDDNDEN